MVSDVTMMLLRSQSISYFNVKLTIWLKGYHNGNNIGLWELDFVSLVG